MKPRLKYLMIYEAPDRATLGGFESPVSRAATLSWKALSLSGVS